MTLSDAHLSTPQRRVLEALESGPLTWRELRAGLPQSAPYDIALDALLVSGRVQKTTKGAERAYELRRA